MSSWPMTFINLSVLRNSPVYRYVYLLWLRDRKLPELRDKEITEERQAGKCSNTAPGPALISTVQMRLARTETSTSIFRWHLHPYTCDESRDKTYVSRGWHRGSSGDGGLKGVARKLRLSKDHSSLATTFWDDRKHSTLKDLGMRRWVPDTERLPQVRSSRRDLGDEVTIWMLVLKERKGR